MATFRSQHAWWRPHASAGVWQQLPRVLRVLPTATAATPRWQRPYAQFGASAQAGLAPAFGALVEDRLALVR